MLRPDSSNFRPSGEVSVDVAEIHRELGNGPDAMLERQAGEWAVIAVLTSMFNDRGYDVIFDPGDDSPAHAYVPTRPTKVHSRELAKMAEVVFLNQAIADNE